MRDSQIPDLILVERFQNGDRSAMDTLVERHKTRAYQLAFRLTRDPELAADVVADAFVRLYRSGQTFKGQSAFSTWLYRIITNCFLDHRKKASSRPLVSLNALLATEEGDVEWELPTVAPSAYDRAVSSEQEIG
jgi:RNA polymerase sigma-70 factor (ECF subfamily)